MRVAIISDVHSNLEALQAVLADADVRDATDVWCTGDIVGYGPEPSAVLAELRRRDATLVAGNHDLAACGKMGVEEFNPVAATAALWTREQLSQDDLSFLAALPLVREIGDFTLVHGTLRQPEWEYLLSPEEAAAHLALQRTRYGIVGHTHLPVLVRERPNAPVLRRPSEDDPVTLADERLILNPGGAGQPRDGDPRAPYMLYDATAATITLRRVAYDFETTQRKIRAAGLPELLARRLEQGR